MLTEQEMQNRESLAKAIDLIHSHQESHVCNQFPRIKNSLAGDLRKAVDLIDSVLTDNERS